MIRKFLGSRRGNMAILSGFVMLPAVLVLGSGYDVMRATSSATKLRSVLESAALAAASLTNAREIETVIEDYMDANLIKEPTIRNSLEVAVSSVQALNSKTVEISASASLPTSFLGIIGITALPVKATTIANQSKTTLELSMVMDISSSMRGSKLTNLQAAASDFVDQILNERNIDHTSMNLIPFGGTVNIGPLFDSYVVPTSSATVDPDKATYNIGGSLLTTDFRFTDGDKCLEHPDSDFNDDLLPLSSRSQVPHFWKWWSFHPWCPGEKSSILLNTNDKQALKDRIDEMVLSDGTGMDIGMLWGAKALSPDWSGKLGGDFSERPHPYNGEAMKVLVVMTDGEITQQYRPENADLNNVHENRPEESNLEPNVDSQSSNWGPWKNEYGKADSKNQQTVVNKGSNNSLSTDSDAVAHFKRICAEAKLNNVIVYTIGFKIKEGKLSDELLAQCASDPSKYFFVEDLDIQSAFDSIAASVNALRIVG